MKDQNPDPRAELAGSAADFERFVYHISHDLKASIRALTIVPDWIAEDLEAEFGGVPLSVQKHVSMMSSHAKRLDRMMADLLVYSRVGQEQTIGQVDLGDMLASVVKEQVLPVGFELHEEFEVPVLNAGIRDIEMLLGVFLSNAVKHGASWVCFATTRQDKEILLSATDDGPGIDPKHHVRIFELMTTLKPRDEVEGSGIGLAIAKKIMAHHGGTLSIESDGRSGAKFVASFPIETQG